MVDIDEKKKSTGVQSQKRMDDKSEMEKPSKRKKEANGERKGGRERLNKFNNGSESHEGSFAGDDALPI